MRIIVVGGGRQGYVIAQNIVAREEKPDVIIADIKKPVLLPKGVSFSQCDILDASQAIQLVKGADAVALAVPSEISHQALTHLLAAGVPVVDVSFTPNPPLELDNLAKQTRAVCVVDCGVAPGLCHLMVGAAYAQLGGLDKAKIWVGGIPQQPPKTFKHAVYFNPHDLLAEYVRPARARKNGENYAPHPLDIPAEYYHDTDLGNLEAFLSDGLRSLLTSFPDVNDMAELTLRWPGHLTAMTDLHEMGLLAASESLSAIATTLGKQYPASIFPDVLVMVVEASKGNQSIGWRLIDWRTGEDSAMSRTTAYTTAAMTMALARKQFTKPGVYPPEYLGQDSKMASLIINDLIQHGIKIETLK